MSVPALDGDLTHPTAGRQTTTSVPAFADAGTGSGLRERVLAALAEVYDPELDEPITRLRFVSSCAVSDDGDADVRLRLPTPQCAPNFAFLMGADARRAVRAVPGVRDVTIRFEDHYTGEEINLALRDGAGFTAAFPGETDDDELNALRAIFTRKALIGRQADVCERLLADGVARERVTELTVADLPDIAAARRVLELRAQLGISTAPDAPAFVTPGGEPVASGQLTRWLRGAQLIRLGLEANGGICRDLLKARHGLAAEPEEMSA
jgi:metal-sulfur cluster biosynthetic enzyme